MMCPKCYGKMDKNTGVCKNCGFSVHDLIGATNAKAKIAKSQGKKDDIMYTSKLPNDVSKKKLMLFGGLLGLFGAHNFYVGKIAKGVFQASAAALLVIMMVLDAIFQFSMDIQKFESVAFFAVGISTLLWVIDFLAICFNRFKVPVYKEEYSIRNTAKTVNPIKK